LSYRTGVSNALTPNAAYKIHLLYNVLAQPSEKNAQTKSGDPSATTFSWALSAIPEFATGIRPTAHFIIESDKAVPSTLRGIENILYGTSGTEPALPTVTDLIQLFTDGVPTSPFTVTDLGSDIYQISGTDEQVSLIGAGLFGLNDLDVTDNGDGTFTAVSP
jgi:hypothetical protein